jgi:hypothetical protein
LEIDNIGGAGVAFGATGVSITGGACGLGIIGGGTEAVNICFSLISIFAISLIVSTFADFTIGEIFEANSSRTESFTIVPQLGQTDNVDARFLLQAGQFIGFEKLENWNCSFSEV